MKRYDNEDFLRFEKKHEPVSLYKLTTRIINKNLNTCEKNKNLVSGLKKNIKNLKKLDMIQTRNKIEIEKFGTTNLYISYPIDTRINKYSYYARIIGLVDAYIEFYKEREEFELSRNNIDGVTNIKENIDKLKNKRTQIVNELEKSYDDVDRKILMDTFKHFPSYENFDSLYKYYNKDISSKRIHTFIIDSYNNGYNSVFNNGIHDIFKLHVKLQKNLDNYKIKNIAKYSNSAVKIRAKKFH